MSDEIELKPCPFCGGENLVAFDDFRNGYEWVKCGDCKARGPYVPENVDESWNTRTDTLPTWQPIETAPRDQEILVCQSQNGIITTARGVNKHGNWITGPGAMSYIVGVTHWMPLPTPPKGDTHD